MPAPDTVRSVSTRTLQRRCARGELVRILPGQYVPADIIPTEDRVMQWINHAQPLATMNLISALSFHRATTQIPDYLSVAIPRGTRGPVVLCAPVLYRPTKPVLLQDGYEQHQGEYGSFRVTTLERTIADCCKHRNKIGMDVFLEALRMAQSRLNLAELCRQAEALRILNVITPHLQTLFA